jgi:2-keto-4-pentenoate hydratase/2-oxohepta-3-ene-1,7-dioic acid hydratase in catechol pathway
MIAAWQDVREPLAHMAEQGAAGRNGITLRRLDEVRLLPPLPSPQARIFALGANFADHAANAKSVLLGRKVTQEEVLAEPGQGLPPWGFIVLPQTVVGSGATLIPPRGATMVDYEAEVAVVLRSGGRHLSPDDLDVWGFTAFNDFSLRDHYFGRGTAVDRGILVWGLSKNFETANACGPWMVVDEPYDVGKLQMCCRVNGQVRQDSSTAEMVYSFGATAEHISDYVELASGDMLTSGTPAGTAIESGVDGPYLNAGDEVEVEVEGVGVLRTVVGKPVVPAVRGRK